MSFLNAEWRKLALANYEIDPAVLANDIPFGTELDLWNGKCYLSLVGFMFVNTHMLGIKVPWHVNFEEVNLRFYVKRKMPDGWRRGVVFIKEIVPKPALAIVANTLYREHYESMPMNHSWITEKDFLEVEYAWRKKRQWQYFRVRANPAPVPLSKGSEGEFITEHYWGYTQIKPGKSFEYEVTHPSWSLYEVLSHEIAVDFGLTYGDRFHFLNEMEPLSVMLAEGSEITVENKQTLR